MIKLNVPPLAAVQLLLGSVTFRLASFEAGVIMLNRQIIKMRSFNYC